MTTVRIVVLAFSVCLPLDASAADLRGTVKDGSGAAVVKATVSVLTPRQAVVGTTLTDESGSFSIPTIAPGDYVIRVEADGFTEHRSSATVSDGAAQVDIVLDVAAVREKVTVTAAPGYAQEAARAVRPVSVISREDIDRRVSRFVAEAVQEEPGVHLQNTSPTMSGVFVRGLTGNKVNVFVDGVRYSNGAQRGGVNTFLNLIDPSVVDGVEIVHGPNSAEYGSDALGGTIQFQTRTPALAASGTRIGGEVALGGQTGHQGGGGNGALSIGTSTFGLFASGGGRKVGEIRTGGGID